MLACFLVEFQMFQPDVGQVLLELGRFPFSTGVDGSLNFKMRMVIVNIVVSGFQIRM